jgi:hypothetical protein
MAAQVEVPGGGEAIASIISAAAENQDACRHGNGHRAQFIDNDIGNAPAGIFHKHDAGNGKTFARSSIDVASLRAGNGHVGE